MEKRGVPYLVTSEECRSLKLLAFQSVTDVWKVKQYFTGTLTFDRYFYLINVPHYSSFPLRAKERDEQPNSHAVPSIYEAFVVETADSHCALRIFCKSITKSLLLRRLAYQIHIYDISPRQSQVPESNRQYLDEQENSLDNLTFLFDFHNKQSHNLIASPHFSAISKHNFPHPFFSFLNMVPK